MNVIYWKLHTLKGMLNPLHTSIVIMKQFRIKAGTSELKMGLTTNYILNVEMVNI